MYSDSVDESATVGCFFAAQDTAPPAKQNKYPPTDFLSTSPPQLTSLYAFISNPTFPSNVIPRWDIFSNTTEFSRNCRNTIVRIEIFKDFRSFLNKNYLKKNIMNICYRSRCVLSGHVKK